MLGGGLLISFYMPDKNSKKTFYECRNSIRQRGPINILGNNLGEPEHNAGILNHDKLI